VRVFVGRCFDWFCKWECDRFLLGWGGGAVEAFDLVSIGSGAIVVVFVVFPLVSMLGLHVML
jgi:hypothetical protein